jgi:hypothetical protein
MGERVRKEWEESETGVRWRRRGVRKRGERSEKEGGEE